jgi:hypothetical protein
MARNDESLAVTVHELKLAGFVPVVSRSKHWKIKCDGLPPITVSVSASDPMAVHMARRTVRKIMAQNRR